MRARDVMSSPVVTVSPDTPLKDVAATLVERGINAVPVVDGDDRLVGIVSEADLLPLEATPGPGSLPARQAARKGPAQTARDVMSRPVYTLAEDTDTTTAARQLLEALARTVPGVVEVRGTTPGPMR
jgi:CBS domain-containing protein